MNKMVKVSLAGLAAAAMIAPASVAFAQKTGPNFYGQVNYQLQMYDDGTDTLWESNSNASRLGVRGNYALDGGLTAIYQIESGFNYGTDHNPGNNGLATRDTFVGLRGDFGTFTVGRQSHSFRQFAGLQNYSTDAQEPWSIGLGSRQNDTIKYTGKAGDIGFGVSLMPTMGAETGDMSFALGLGGKISNEISFGLGALMTSDPDADFPAPGSFGYGSANRDETVIGLKVEYKAGPLTAALGYQTYDEADYSEVVVPVKFDINSQFSVQAAVNMIMDFNDEDSMNFMAGFDYRLGGGTTLYLNYIAIDEDSAPRGSSREADSTTIAFGINHAF